MDNFNTLNRFGFKKGCIAEIILTTYNPDGTGNAAPMGAEYKNKGLIKLSPFKTSNTYRNLDNGSRACINVTNNPILFLVTAFKEEHLVYFPEPRIDKDLRLESADAHIFAEQIEKRYLSEIRSNYLYQIKTIEIIENIPKLFSRGKAQAIEAVILATRIKVFNKTNKKVRELIEQYKKCKQIVCRISSNESDEVQVIKTLDNLIKKWINQR
jgi:hypothetical protein